MPDLNGLRIEYKGAAMDKEEAILRNRLCDLAERAYKQNIYTYSSFLSPADQTVLLNMERELAYIPMELWGGMPEAERKVAAFGAEAVFGYKEPFPISCIRISPLQKKFAEELSHRDYLGALMHLGIERDVLGDIMVRDREAFVFCLDAMAGHIIKTVSKIRHTSVRCELVKEIPDFLVPELIERQETVVSARIDVVVAAVYHLSRSQASTLFVEQKVSVNGRMSANHSYVLKEEDRVSVRGYGRFVFKSVLGQTKKGRLLISILQPEV